MLQKEGGNGHKLENTTGALSWKIKKLVKTSPNNPEVLDLMERYLEWFFRGGIARPGTIKWLLGSDIYRQADLLQANGRN